tara:strand:- start:25896 stop:27557 length:1662 start_codon:yes stop_codon:yes gene_type:complete
MPIYRSDQSQLTFATESTPGGYPEYATSVTNLSGGPSATALNGAHNAGSLSLTVDSSSGLQAGHHIRIGSVTHETEVRTIEIVSGTSLVLSAPTSFYHPNDAVIQAVSAVAYTAGDIIINQIPGVYESVDLPDPEMSIEPQYFLGTNAKRNFNRVLTGQQTYSGSIGNFVLLDGRPLRFPIGKVITNPSNTVTQRTYITTSTVKGDRLIVVNSAANLVVGDRIGIDVPLAVSSDVVSSTSVGEVRKITAIASTIIHLDYPLQFAHATAGSGTTQVVEIGTAGYTHTILETTDLPSMTWHAHMRSSDETEAITHDFDRRYFGGKVGSATLSAEEGGMLNMGWDTVPFLGMIHNQNSSTVSSTNNVVPFYSLMQPIRSTDVVQPTTEPYYFSSGTVTMFGTTIARMRSFSLSINNNLESRYYISSRGSTRRRGPTEIREARRDYSMSATLALPDTQNQLTSTARTLFNELLNEGQYGAAGRTGFNITLTFTRGTNDTITITIPDDGTSASGGDQQGAFIRSAPHNITAEGVFQVDVDILFRNLKIEIEDSEHYYP